METSTGTPTRRHRGLRGGRWTTTTTITTISNPGPGRSGPSADDLYQSYHRQSLNYIKNRSHSQS